MKGSRALCVLAGLSAVALLALTNQRAAAGKNPMVTEEIAVDQTKVEKNPTVIMETSMGTIKIELFADKAPITVKNFLQYVDDKHYDGVIFHRVMEDFMIQGGGVDTRRKEKKHREGIENESTNGLSNERGTIAMARTDKPHSASAQFFINVKDNTFLDRAKARDGVGYCVFGKVTEGMDVVDKIRRVPTGNGELELLGAGGALQRGVHENVPKEDVIIKSVKRAEK